MYDDRIPSSRSFSAVNAPTLMLSRSSTPTSRSCSNSGITISERTFSEFGISMYRGSSRTSSTRTGARAPAALPVMPLNSGTQKRTGSGSP